MNKDITTGYPFEIKSIKGNVCLNKAIDNANVETTSNSSRECFSPFFSIIRSTRNVISTYCQTLNIRAGERASEQCNELKQCLSGSIDTGLIVSSFLTFLAIPSILAAVGAAVLQVNVAVAAKSGAAGILGWMISLLLVSCLARSWQICTDADVEDERKISTTLFNFSEKSLVKNLYTYLKLTVLLGACATTGSLFGLGFLNKTDRDKISPNELACSTALGAAIATLSVALSICCCKPCLVECQEEIARFDGSAC